jgi:hypothetical protein
VHEKNTTHLSKGACLGSAPGSETLTSCHHNAWWECVWTIRDRALCIAMHGDHSLHEWPEGALLIQRLIAQKLSSVEEKLERHLRKACTSLQIQTMHTLQQDQRCFQQQRASKHFHDGAVALLECRWMHKSYHPRSLLTSAQFRALRFVEDVPNSSLLARKAEHDSGPETNTALMYQLFPELLRAQ